jgi:hypothetical protein
MPSPTPEILEAAKAANVKPDDLLKWRETPTTIIIINTRGQKFIIPKGETQKEPKPNPKPTTSTPRKAPSKPQNTRKA